MKLLLVLIFLVSGIFAKDIVFEQNENVKKEQRKLITVKDYNDYIKTMKSAIKYGDYSAAIYLGALYIQDIKLKDRVMKADIRKAKKYFRLAYNKGYGFAAFYLSKLEEPNEAILDIKNALYMKNTKKKIRELLAIRYAEIVLNNEELYKNKKAIEMAIADINPISLRSDNPILDFELAHLFFLDKQYNKANKYINSACNNPKAGPQLLALCLNDPYLNKRGENEKIDATKKLQNISDKMGSLDDSGNKNRCTATLNGKRSE
ncbi:hypothetical protein [Sulfurimonas indica]|uniref:hypothetical protein n=1 Tax=Sulfurimonas TaxID=202746 RepID=UPI0012645243|nr:hypothetical protein [Sulfurimonas indica]